MDMDRMSLPKSVDDVEILISADLYVLRCSHFKHVVCSNHKSAISWQTEERSMPFDCNGLLRNG